jgi:ubiquinone/menaquinone biosynthesis C-methylase UbiE
MAPQPEPRKLEEAEFHDRLRGLYETDPKQYGYYTSNKKFYAVSGASDAFFFNWLRENATGKRILDFGCGSGIHTTAMARFAGHVTGIDISPEAIRLAQEHAQSEGLAAKTTFVVKDAENLDLPSGSFDVVTVHGVLHHMDLDVAVTQMKRVLTRDGKAIFLEALANNPIIHAYRKRTPHLRTAWETEHILRYEDSAKMRKYFKRVEARSFHLAVLAAVPLRNTPVFRPARAALNAIDSAILRLPGLRRQGWIAVFMLSEPV